ncbi:MAG: YkvA family protein [Planctomycetota bacterium]|jgi:uncharacterized membrane protein YkvA (DUF1232 family)
MSDSSDPQTTQGFDEDFIRRGAESVTEADLDAVRARSEELRRKFDQPGPIGHIRSSGHLLVALVGDYREGDYREVPWWAMAAVGFCLLYVLNPIDAMPDAIPVLGQVDDAIVISACLLLIDQELQKYKHWKLAQLDVGDEA